MVDRFPLPLLPSNGGGIPPAVLKAYGGGIPLLLDSAMVEEFPLGRQRYGGGIPPVYSPP